MQVEEAQQKAADERRRREDRWPTQLCHLVPHGCCEMLNVHLCRLNEFEWRTAQKYYPILLHARAQYMQRSTITAPFMPAIHPPCYHLVVAQNGP